VRCTGRVEAGRRAGDRHEPAQPRQQLAKEFGATDIVPERGDEGIARVKELTEGVGADLDPQIVASGLRA
jgi:threonine dehydrogenase-like Zn-dependent dehydrogenase